MVFLVVEFALIFLGTVIILVVPGQHPVNFKPTIEEELCNDFFQIIDQLVETLVNAFSVVAQVNGHAHEPVSVFKFFSLRFLDCFFTFTVVVQFFFGQHFELL